MKSAPSFIAAVTAVAALGAGALLAIEDRMLFEPGEALLVALVDEVGPGLQAPEARRVGLDVRHPVTRAGSGAPQERR